VHGTCARVGERVGNAELDLLIVNLNAGRASPRHLEAAQYCRLVADAMGADRGDIR